MDFWSSLEHQMKYKQNIKNQELIVEELKRCADEIATTDLNMQTIRNMIEKGEKQ
jgi:putative GTP pyrophosphokinase